MGPERPPSGIGSGALPSEQAIVNARHTAAPDAVIDVVHRARPPGSPLGPRGAMAPRHCAPLRMPTAAAVVMSTPLRAPDRPEVRAIDQAASVRILASPGEPGRRQTHEPGAVGVNDEDREYGL